MADKKISALTSASTPLAGTEVLPIVQGASTVKVAVSDLTAGRAVSATSVAAGLGLVSTPAYTFTGDLNTGMWSPAADTIAFSEGGTEAARITSASLVGIGTTAPVGRLMVAAADTSNTIGSATASINITNTDAGATGRTSNLNFTVDDGNLTTRRLATISAVYTGFGGGSTEGALAFATQFNGSLSERMRISSAGDITASTGNLVIGTSGKGIDFAATAGTGTSELLADYEEGTWTPDQGSGLTVVGAFSSSGTYTKVGRIVTLSGELNGATSIACAGGQPLFTNSPYSGSTVGTGTIANSSITASTGSVYGGLILYAAGALGASNKIYFSVTYFV